VRISVPISVSTEIVAASSSLKPSASAGPEPGAGRDSDCAKASAPASAASAAAVRKILGMLVLLDPVVGLQRRGPRPVPGQGRTPAEGRAFGWIDASSDAKCPRP
jgi:hypothetical protein